jgi:hypothetical protein
MELNMELMDIPSVLNEMWVIIISSHPTTCFCIKRIIMLLIENWNHQEDDRSVSMITAEGRFCCKERGKI